MKLTSEEENKLELNWAKLSLAGAMVFKRRSSESLIESALSEGLVV